MTSTAIANANAKLERAYEGLRLLTTTVEEFIADSKYEMTSRYCADRDEQIWSFRLRGEVPAMLPVLVGEILHNARSALDQIVCELALAHSGSTRDIYFPTGRSEEVFSRRLSECAKRLPSRAVEVIRDAKPFPDGNTALWLLHDLNRRDKHIRLITVNVRTSSNDASALTVLTGMALVIGSRSGQHLLVDRRPDAEIAAMESPTAVYETPPGTFMQLGTEGCLPEESLDFLVTTPGATFKSNIKPNFMLAIEREGAIGTSVDDELSSMLDAASAVVDSFESRCF